jgi:DNA-directed RNA polymerase subunit RPC12/RpoP
MTVDQLTQKRHGPTPCLKCGHWVGGPDVTPPYECVTCGAFVAELRSDRR